MEKAPKTERTSGTKAQQWELAGHVQESIRLHYGWEEIG